MPGNDIYYQCADLVLRRTEPIACSGDCNDDGHVSLEELITGIRISMGLDPTAQCPQFDSDEDGRVRVDDVVRAVRSALGSCHPSP